MIRIENLCKIYKNKTKAIVDLNINFNQGSITGIVGSDGAGKTTLLRIIAGIISPTLGKVYVDNFNNQTQMDKIKPILGYMPQFFGLYQDLSVIENLELFASLKGVKGEDKVDTFDKLLNFTGLKKFENRFAGKLSGGMKQKLALACTMIGPVKVVLLDEPGVGVDIIARGELWKMVNELAKSGITILWSTSYLDEAERFKDILLLNEGKVLYKGAPKELNKSINGRVFLVNPKDYYRNFLQNALKLDEVKDAVFQGQNIKFIFKEIVALSEVKKLLNEQNVEQIVPTFEDAFIDELGGIKNKISNLDELAKQDEQSEQIAIKVKNLTKKFGDFYANKDVNFDVQSGEIFGLIGPNGAGKTTAFKMMCGLLDISSGEAEIFGQSIIKDKIKVRSFLGYMSQKFALYDDLSVLQNLDFFCGIYGLNSKNAKTRVKQMLKAFELDKDILTKDLPLGFKQRLALACALLHKPKVLFLDEPTSGVDIVTRREFWIHINALAKSKITIVVTTHFLEEAEYCDKIALINGGKLIAFGAPNELKQKVGAKNMNEAFIELIKENK